MYHGPLKATPHMVTPTSSHRDSLGVWYGLWLSYTQWWLEPLPRGKLQKNRIYGRLRLSAGPVFSWKKKVELHNGFSHLWSPVSDLHVLKIYCRKICTKCRRVVVWLYVWVQVRSSDPGITVTCVWSLGNKLLATNRNKTSDYPSKKETLDVRFLKSLSIGFYTKIRLFPEGKVPPSLFLSLQMFFFNICWLNFHKGWRTDSWDMRFSPDSIEPEWKMVWEKEALGGLCLVWFAGWPNVIEHFNEDVPPMSIISS